MKNKEHLNKNKNNFPINVVEQKETKNIYSSKKGKKEIKNKNIKEIKKKEEEKENIIVKEETDKENELKELKEIKKEENENEEEKEEEEKEIKEEKIDNNNDELLNNNTFNNNDNKITKELKIKFNDIIKDEFEFPDKLPLIKRGSYLTELPSNAYNNSKKNLNTTKKTKYKESSKVMKYLKEKELSLNKEISNIKDKKERLMNVSFNNIGLSDIEKNRNNYEKKKLQTIENNLMEKLNEVKFQIKGILQREKLLKNSKSELIQNFIKRYENEDTSNFRKYLKISKKIMFTNPHREENKIEEKKEDINESKKEKEKEKTEEDKKKEKRRKKIKEEVSKLAKNPTPKKYLFFQMANKFEEEQKLIYQSNKTTKKIEIDRKEELKKFYKEYKEKQKEMKEKCSKKSEEMKKQWRSNSLILQKYKSPLKIRDIDDKEKEKLKIEEFKKKIEENKLNLKIPLPKINENLRKQNLKQNLSLNDLKGRDRVKHIKEELNHIKKLIKRSYDLENKRYKQSNILNRHKLEIKITNKNKSKTINKIEKKNKKVNVVINYLEDSKRNSNKNIIWDKYLYEPENMKTNIRNIKGQIEGIDNNVEIKKEILKINGGFFNNQKLGNELSNLLINSINGKFSVIKAMNNSI